MLLHRCTVINHKSFLYSVVSGAEHFNTPINIETVIKQLNEEESAQYLKNFFGPQSVFTKCKDFKVPSFDTFSDEKMPDWSLGTTMARTVFESLVHFELSVYWLYKGHISDASHHFKSQKSKPEQYGPYLKISAVKMDGFKKALGLGPATATESSYTIPTLDIANVAEMAKLMRKGNISKLKGMMTGGENEGTKNSLPRLNAEKIENYEASLLTTGITKMVHNF